MYSQYEYLTKEDIEKIKDVCKNSNFAPLQIEENNSEPFDEQVIINNINDKEFHAKFKAKLDELDKEYSEYESNR